MIEETRKRIENEQIEIEKQIGFKADQIRKLNEQIVELNTVHLKNQGRLEMLAEIAERGINDGGSEAEPSNEDAFHRI